MPQMSPMNWFFLFLYFLFWLYLAMVKIHFLHKANNFSESLMGSLMKPSFKLFI